MPTKSRALSGLLQGYSGRKPIFRAALAILVIQVTDTTLAYDRDVKAPALRGGWRFLHRASKIAFGSQHSPKIGEEGRARRAIIGAGLRENDDTAPPCFPTLTRLSRRADIVPMALHLLKGPFTVESYQRLGELGILRDDDRVELIHGQVVEMTPIGDRHAACVRRMTTLFAPHVPRLAIINVQNAVVLAATDAPQPDLAVLKPRPDRYLGHPRADDVLLVIEVADMSLAYDRDTKIPLYARAGIPDAWLVDLTGDRIGIHREPRGDRYTRVHWAARGEILTPLLLTQVVLSVTEILG